MFDFQKLEVYKKAELFHSSCKKVIREKNLDNYVKDQIEKQSESVVSSSDFFFPEGTTRWRSHSVSPSENPTGGKNVIFPLLPQEAFHMVS